MRRSDLLAVRLAGARRDVAETKALLSGAGLQTAAALAGELIGERDLLALGKAEDVRAKLAIEILVLVGDLLAPKNDVSDEPVGLAGRDRHSLQYAGRRLKWKLSPRTLPAKSRIQGHVAR